MPEPLTIASSVGALVMNAYKLCFVIYQIIDKINNAPKNIRSLSRDLKAFYSVLGTLQGYLDDEETAKGVLHPATSTDLQAVLQNCMTIFRDVNAIVNGFIKKSHVEVSSSTTPGAVDVTRWQSIQSTWKEGELRELRAQLVAHKRTLNVAIAAANLIKTSTTCTATQRIEKEVRELKSTLAILLQRIDEVNERSQEGNVVMRNYNTTIRQFARGADSIMTASTFPEAPPSPSPKISLLEPSIGIGSSNKTAHSRSTYETAPSHQRAETVIEILDDPTSDAKSMKTIQAHWGPGSPGQLFVKGLQQHTIALQLPELPERAFDLKDILHHKTGTPPDFISLLKNGRLLNNDSLLVDAGITRDSTLQAYVNAKAMREQSYLVELEEHEMRWMMSDMSNSTSSTLGELSLEAIYRKENSRQTLYTRYLRLKGGLRLRFDHDYLI